MDFQNQLLFFFSALGAFNGLLLCLYFLFIAKPKHYSNIYLGLLLAALSLRIGKSTVYYFNPELAKIYLQIGLGGCFFIGPFLFFYVKSKINPTTTRLWNILLFLLLLLYIVVGLVYSYQENPQLWNIYFYKVIFYQWLAFILATGFLLKEHFKKVLDPKAKLTYDEVMLLNVFLGVSIIWFAYFTSKYTSYIVGALSFSFILYLSIFILFFKRQKTTTVPKKKYANKNIPQAEAQQLAKKIEGLMTEQELYKKSNLTLPELAKELGVSPHLLSQFLNNNLNKSFSQFTNEYRIKKAIELLKAQKNLKITAIAEICGFNSSSTFYAAFKKFTKTTPADYIKKL